MHTPLPVRGAVYTQCILQGGVPIRTHPSHPSQTDISQSKTDISQTVRRVWGALPWCGVYIPYSVHYRHPSL
jgi:hypothetical protein